MAENTWPRKCIHCGETCEFNGSDVSFSGFGPCKKRRGKHEVESVIYYHPGARDISDPRDRRMFSPTIVLQPIYTREVDGQRVQSRGISVQFFDGKLESSDPEVQFLLEEKKDIAWGEDGLKMWREIYLTIDQQNNIAQAELADTKRQIKEQNDLLAAVKAGKIGKAAVGA